MTVMLDRRAPLPAVAPIAPDALVPGRWLEAAPFRFPVAAWRLARYDGNAAWVVLAMVRPDAPVLDDGRALHLLGTRFWADYPGAPVLSRTDPTLNPGRMARLGATDLGRRIEPLLAADPRLSWAAAWVQLGYRVEADAHGPATHRLACYRQSGTVWLGTAAAAADLVERQWAFPRPEAACGQCGHQQACLLHRRGCRLGALILFESGTCAGACL